MPLQWRLHVLGAKLEERIGCAVRFEENELFRLEGGQRNAALDVLVTGAPLPILLLGDVVVGVGELDADAIGTAIERLTGS
jgi:hypothetical protein